MRKQPRCSFLINFLFLLHSQNAIFSLIYVTSKPTDFALANNSIPVPIICFPDSDFSFFFFFFSFFLGKAQYRWHWKKQSEKFQ